MVFQPLELLLQILDRLDDFCFGSESEEHSPVAVAVGRFDGWTPTVKSVIAPPTQVTAQRQPWKPST